MEGSEKTVYLFPLTAPPKDISLSDVIGLCCLISARASSVFSFFLQLRNTVPSHLSTANTHSHTMSAPVSTTQTSTTAAPQVLRLSDHDDDDNTVKQDSSSSGNRDRKDDKTNNAVSVPWDIPSPPTFQDPHEYRAHLKGRLALAFRIFAKYGYDEGVAGHITVKDPVDPTCFWVNPFGVSWARLQASDLILVNSQGTVVAGGPVRRLNTGAFMIHHAGKCLIILKMALLSLLLKILIISLLMEIY